MTTANTHVSKGSPHFVVDPSTKCSFLQVIVLCFKLVMVFVAFMLYAVIVPLFFIFTIPMYLYRGVVIVLQKVFHPSWVGIMSSRDALVGCDDTTKKCECIMTAIMVFKGEPDIDKCTAHLQKYLIEAKRSKSNEKLTYGKLQHYYENWMGFPFWKKESNFNLREHFRLFDYNVKKCLGDDGLAYATEDEVLRAIGDIERLPFKKGQSPWEVLLLPNYLPTDLHMGHTIPDIVQSEDDSQGKHFALVFRFHHALGDGYSSLKMLMCHFCNEPVESVPKAPIKKFSLFQQIGNAIAIILFTPYHHLQQFVFQIDSSHWHLGTNELNKKSHFVASERFPMADLKRVGKAYKVPLTGVFLAGLAGGIHNYLKKTGKGHLMTKYMRAFSPMPWKNHPAYSGRGFSNHWTTGVFAIPVGHDSTEKRLMASKKSMMNLISSPVLVANFYTVPVLLSTPNFFTSIWGTNWMTSMILSNFPGPKEVIKGFGEFDYVETNAYVPHMRGSAGLGVMFATSLDLMRCCLSVDTAILKEYGDAQLLIRCIDEEFRKLQELRYASHAENNV